MHLLGCLALAGLLSSGGCAARGYHARGAREAFFAGDLDGAADGLARTGRSGDTDVLLDEAMLALFAARPVDAERKFRQARDRFDYLEQHDIGESALVLATDDTRRGYAGENYEKVLTRVFLVIANLMGEGQDALAYSFQVDQKQREMMGGGGYGEPPTRTRERVSIGRYLHGLLQEESLLNYDDAERSFADVLSWEPTFSLARLDLERARGGVHSRPGHGVVVTLAMVGRGPVKIETAAPVTSEALLLADRILSSAGEHSLPPTIAPVKITEVVAPPVEVRGVEVLSGGRPIAWTETITDVGRLAVSHSRATRNQALARAVARRALKKAAVYATKDALSVDPGWASLALDAAGVVWEATESADTRGWRFLPGRIQVARLELPAGDHRLGLRAHGARGGIGETYETTVRVVDGRNTYVLAWFPSLHPVGRILRSSSGPVDEEIRGQD